MLDIKMKIQFNEQALKELNVTADSYNRVSAFTGGGYENSPLQTQSTPYRRIILGKSIYGSQDLLSAQYDGLWGGVGSGNDLYDANDASKGYKINNSSAKYTLTLNGATISNLKIIFDAGMNIYAKVVAINGELYYNDSIEFECANINSDVVTIDILSLNDSNVPVVINSLMFDSDIVYDRNSGLLEVKRGSEKTSDNVLPTYGIIGQYGHAQFVDYTDLVKNLIKDNKLKRTVAVTIYNGNMVLGKYETSKDWDYNIYTKEVSIDLQDKIMKWQEVQIEKPQISYDVTATQIYNYLLQYCTDFTFDVSRETISFWNNISVPYFYLENDTLWNQWNKFLNFTQSVLYTMPDGKIKIVRSK